jgi:glycosyltransferase involved in cell wall biosynthesis
MPLPKKIAIFSHDIDGTTSACAGLIGYLNKNKAISVIVCQFPFQYSIDGSIKIRRYKQGRLVNKQRSLIKFYKPEYLSYIKDIILGVIYGFKFCQASDLFVGTPNILALVGLFLKKMGVVKKVVYYQIDYTPVRYRNRFLNDLYFQIDRYVCFNCDEVWSLTQEMINAKSKDRGWDINKIKYRLVPTGNDSDRLKKIDWEKCHNDRIIYFGGIYKNKGADLFVPIVKSLLKHNFKKFIIECLGGGEVDILKKEIEKNNLEKYFIVHGQIENKIDAENIMLKGAIALAPYYPEDKNNFSYYSDPGKIKDYLACGLPVITTAVPPIAKTLATKGAGIISIYDPDAFAQSIITLLSNKQSLMTTKKRARKLGLSYSWNNIFNKVFIKNK